MTITLKTRLHEGIQQIGGKTITEYEWTTGPRNLVKAIKTLYRVRKENEQAYGNIGCGRSWLEIDGQPIHIYDVEYVNVDERATYYRGRDAEFAMFAKSRTQKARELIAQVQAGKYSGIY